VRPLRSCVLGLACLAFLGPVAATAAPTARPLRTAVLEEIFPNTSDQQLEAERVRAAGATAFRTGVNWADVAPVELPKKFNAQDSFDHAYSWGAVDDAVRLLASHGLDPILYVFNPPIWAGGGGSPAPDPTALHDFMLAAASRYSGENPGLPRVRYWQVWNEPNVKIYFSQLFPDPSITTTSLYRMDVNAAADAIHSIHSDNLVIAGGLSPFAVPDGLTETIAPLSFMRDLLCVSAGAPPQKTCSDPIHFDVWAIHPYTWGGPTTPATKPGDASLGDMPATQDILRAAAAAGNVVSAKPPELWVTEFSWDTNPPDPAAVPVYLQSRWASEAFYRMWNAGVSLVTWLHVRDHPYPALPTQSGLYFRGGDDLLCDAPKPTLTAFEFPFVAYQQSGRIVVWGRTPQSNAAKVVIQRAASKKWKTLATLRADRYGIFSVAIRKSVPKGSYLQGPLVLRSQSSSCPAGPDDIVGKPQYVSGRYLRATVKGGGASLPFSLTPPPAAVYPPFG
jgi:hypothetical protein